MTQTTNRKSKKQIPNATQATLLVDPDLWLNLRRIALEDNRYIKDVVYECMYRYVTNWYVNREKQWEKGRPKTELESAIFARIVKETEAKEQKNVALAQKKAQAQEDADLLKILDALEERP